VRAEVSKWLARMRPKLIAFLLAWLPLLVSAATTNVSVGQGGANFNPSEVTIALGDTVTWTWFGNNHSVASGTQFNPDGIFDSGIRNVGAHFSFTPSGAGTYPYYCTVHGAMMTGTITVTAATPSPTPTATAAATPTATPTATVSPATPTPAPSPFTSRPLLFPPVTTAADVPISISEACISILDGPCTYMWTYGGTYPGLTIRRPAGQTTRVTFANDLPSLAGGKTVHHHGNHSASADDGQVTGATFLFEPGQTRTYTYEGIEDGQSERGAMQFYHDHRMGETGMTVWMGLTGLYIIDDPADPTTLPSGEYELPLVIADRQFDADNQLQYFYDPSGVAGDKVLINGVYEPYLDVADRKYRFRIMNGANARIYMLTLSTGEAITQIGTESGLLPAPVPRTALDIGPAQRLDLVVDFAGKLGAELYLRDAFQNVPLLKFRVNRHSVETSTVPATLRPLPDIGQPTVTRSFSFDFTSNHWTINGQRFDPNRIDARPVLGTTEKWVFTNPTGTTHMVHIHDVDQQCLSRDGGPCYAYETMKETWRVGPGETLELKMKFTDHTGIYMLHCHILEHEDDGMMTQFEVVPPIPSPGIPAAPTLNISTRGNVVGGDNDLIAGFIITGGESKRVLLRAIGPSLSAFGVSGALTDPVIRLFNSSSLEIANNDDWQTARGASEIQALGLAPKSASEASMVQSLAPGSYTAVVSGKDASTGIALVEAYDIGQSANSALANISTRGSIGLNDNLLIGGFIVGGIDSAKVIIRAIGPTLANFGITTALGDPTLTVYDKNGSAVITNDNWLDDPNAAAIQSYNLTPSSTKESATYLQLAPGNYTAIVRGVAGGTGTGLVEIYNIP
jgi:spore coat protein A